MSHRFERGMQAVKTMVGDEAIQNTLEGINRFYPDFYKAMIEFGFGDVYSRPTLDLKQREFITLTSLITQGAEGQLPFHLRAALNVGITPEEILEIVMHCAAYAGFPRACGALAVVMQVFSQLGISVHQEQPENR